MYQYAVNSCTQCTSSRYFCIYPQHVHKAHTHTLVYPEIIKFSFEMKYAKRMILFECTRATDSCNSHAKCKHAQATVTCCNIHFTLHVCVASFSRTHPRKTETELPSLTFTYIKLTYENNVYADTIQNAIYINCISYKFPCLELVNYLVLKVYSYSSIRGVRGKRGLQVQKRL